MPIIYLYVKFHPVSNLKYFGRTIRADPFKYQGSGKYWRHHIKKHGKQYIRTLEVYGFDTQEMCTEFALKFSKDNNIVDSKEWANLMIEDGCHGTFNFIPRQPMGSTRTDKQIAGRAILKGRVVSAETRAKMSAARLGKPQSEACREARKGRIVSAETRAKVSATLKGRILSEAQRARLRGKTASVETKAKMSAAHKGARGPYKKRVVKR